MLIQTLLQKKNMSVYRLSKESGIPYATVNDICNGKTDLGKCSAGTVYKLAKALGTTMEELVEAGEEYRSDFETFKSNVCHHVKDMGDLDFLVKTLEGDEVRVLFERQWYPEALYLLAMVDYLSRINDIPMCTNYDDIRVQRLDEPMYAAGVRLASKILQSEEPLRTAEKDAIPEFKRFNIMESEVRDVV